MVPGSWGATEGLSTDENQACPHGSGPICGLPHRHLVTDAVGQLNDAVQWSMVHAKTLGRLTPTPVRHCLFNSLPV